MLHVLLQMTLAATTPAFLINHNAASTAQQTHLGEVSAPDVERLLSSSQREVNIVFSVEGLTTEAVKLHGSRLAALHGLLRDLPSLTLPFTNAHHAQLFDQPEVQVSGGAAAEAYFKSNSQIFTNGVSEMVVVELTDEAGSSLEDQLASHDTAMARVIHAVDAATKGNYAALVVSRPTAHRRLAIKSKAAYLHTSPTLLTAQLVMLILMVIFLSGFCCLFSLQTPKRFEEVKNA